LVSILISADDRQLIDRVRAKARNKSANRLAKEANVAINTARSVKQGSYPKRGLTTDVREKWLAYVDKPAGAELIVNDVPRETTPDISRAKRTLEIIRRFGQRMTLAQLVGAAAETAILDKWSEEEWNEFARWRREIAGGTALPADIPTVTIPAEIAVMIAQALDLSNRRGQELAGRMPGELLNDWRRNPPGPVKGNRRVGAKGQVLRASTNANNRPRPDPSQAEHG